MVGGAARLVDEEEELEGARRGEEDEARGGEKDVIAAHTLPIRDRATMVDGSDDAAYEIGGIDGSGWAK